MAKWFQWPDLPIRVNRRGEWLHGDERLHPRVAILFARHVVPSADGTYRIQLGYARHPLEVDDTPFDVRSMQPDVDAAGALRSVTLVLSDGTQEILDPATLMQSQEHVLYCRIRRHGLAVPCRFTQAQYHSLALYAEMDGERAWVPVAGKRWDVLPYDATPHTA